MTTRIATRWIVGDGKLKRRDVDRRPDQSRSKFTRQIELLEKTLYIAYSRSRRVRPWPARRALCAPASIDDLDRRVAGIEAKPKQSIDAQRAETTRSHARLARVLRRGAMAFDTEWPRRCRRRRWADGRRIIDRDGAGGANRNAARTPVAVGRNRKHAASDFDRIDGANIGACVTFSVRKPQRHAAFAGEAGLCGSTHNRISLHVASWTAFRRFRWRMDRLAGSAIRGFDLDQFGPRNVADIRTAKSRTSGTASVRAQQQTFSTR